MEMYKSTEVLDTLEREKEQEQKKVMVKTGTPQKKVCFLLSMLLCVVGIGALTATTALLLTKGKSGENDSAGCDKDKQNHKARELYSKIRNKYTELYPEAPLVKNDDGSSTIQPMYLNFTPALYKARTEAAKDLLKQLQTVEKDITLSKEENQTFELFRRFLVNTFGPPYENNYEIGDWLLGPNIFCWQESCGLLSHLRYALEDIHPIKTVKDVELMVDFMKKCSEGYKQRIRNLKYGVSVGIVLPDVACRAGLQSFKKIHFHVAKKGAQGIFEQMDIQVNSSISDFPFAEKKKWNRKHNVSMEQYIKAIMVNYVGKSLNEFLRYLENDYSTHCPPSNISSGFASLPLPYVYTNGVEQERTNGSLPGGEKFNGSAAYLILLSHFTTYDITPQEVDELANETIGKLFPQVVKIAKARTKEQGEIEAIKKFRLQLENDEFYYKVVNEANYSAPYMKCYDEKTAQIYCPGRWKAMNQWLKSAKAIIIEAKKNLSAAFYIRGEKQILPTCAVDVKFDFSPANPFHSYSECHEDNCSTCSSNAIIYIPFFLEKPGPKYEEMTIMAHEAYPGHHLEVQGVKEHFEIKCDKLREWVSENNYFAAFSEGWATYIEKDVADQDMKLYRNDMQRYGMLKHQILAALRAKVDVGLHFLGMKRQEAVSLYDKYALDTSDGIQKEITRLQSGPGQGTAYMVGGAKFSEYRTKAKLKLGNKFNVREFHYEVLRHGELPMLYLGKHIDEYILRESEE